MTRFHLSSLTVAQIRQGLLNGEFSARELVQCALAVIDQRDAQIHAFLEHTDALAYEAADQIDSMVAAGERLPILAGVPIAFKDNMNQLGTHTTCGSRMLEHYVSPFSATCVARAIEAGGLPLGKLNMDEFAFGSSTETSAFGCTHNPWDLDRVPGGSSGGSAAAVAAGMATITLGSDTGGSIRQPASFCGVVGMKPTYGMVSRHGVVAFGSSLDQVGPFGKTVADIATALNAICGRDPLDCTSQARSTDFCANLDQGIKGMRIGIVPAFLEAPGVDPEITSATNKAYENLERLGAKLVEIELPNANAAMSAYYVIGPCEAFSNLSRFDSIRYGYCHPDAATLGEQYEQSRSYGFGPEAIRRIMLGSYLLSSGIYNKYYYPAQQVRTLITEDYDRAFEQVEAIVTPVSPRSAFKLGEIADPTAMYLSDMFTISINIAGNGGMSLPVGLGATSGMPVGVQIIGPQFKDENILRVGAALESCYDIDRLAPVACASEQRCVCSDSPRFAAELASGLISDDRYIRYEDFPQDQKTRSASADVSMQDLNAHSVSLEADIEGLDANKSSKVAQPQGLDASYAARSASMSEQTHPCASAIDGYEQTRLCAEPLSIDEGGAR